VILPREVLDAVVAHARASLPAECCGLLIGRADRVVKSVRAKNLDESPNRFLIDPRDHIEALRQARSRGLDVVGFYHSHPHSEAHPSPSDVAEAFDSDHVHLIVSLRDDRPETRAFRFGRAGFAELPIEEGDPSS
jgi:proteasome lid subunit RPN8/RPN11